MGEWTERVVRLGLGADRLVVGVEDRAQCRLPGRREEVPIGALTGVSQSVIVQRHDVGRVMLGIEADGDQLKFVAQRRILARDAVQARAAASWLRDTRRRSGCR